MQEKPVLQLADPPRKTAAIVAAQKITVFGCFRITPAK
jgi:hypothetical protein